MRKISRAKPSPPSFLDQGKEAFIAGRFHLAAEAFVKARAAEPGNPVPLFNLASAKERIGDIDEAAVLLTQALRLRPTWFDPAQRLALLLARYVVKTPGELDPHGLAAAFNFDRIDLQPVAAAAIAHLAARSPLGEAIARAEKGEAAEAARDWLVRRTEPTLSHPLLQNALTHSANRHPGFERLLTAMRRVLLLELPPERFLDRSVTAFALGLIQQCYNNEYVFAVSAEEEVRLARTEIDWNAVREASPEEARKLMLLLLYRGPQQAVAVRLTSEERKALRPRGLGDFLAQRLAEDEEQARLAESVVTLGEIQDATSRKVAAQYEAHPYPRWTSLQMPAPDSARVMLKRFAAAEKLGFLDEPFRVLIAGAGTGQHALAASVRYGERADVLAIDLSRASLAYGAAKAAHFGARNLRFARADLLDLPETAGPFDIIEAVGVLHHMAEPFKGWQALLKLLRPGGLMLVGLYSGVSRQSIAELRREPGYPGPSCDDDAARAYRASLMDRQDKAGGLKSSYDFYALSNFRDLVLHEHERPIFLSEIEAFLEQNGLTFRGFGLPPLVVAAFLQTFPEDAYPGRLDNWAKFEETHPRTFDAMYQLWCEKA